MEKSLTVLYVCTDWYECAGSTDSLINLIHSVKNEVFPIVLLSHDGAVKDEFDRLGIETIVHPFFYLWDKPKPLKTVLHHPTRATFLHYLRDNRRCARFVCTILKDRKIDIVHSNTSITTVGVNIAKQLNATHIWHIREFLDLDFNVDVYGGRNHLKRQINKSDARICISQAMSMHWNLKDEETFIIHDAVLSDISMVESIDKKKILIFCAAIISSHKGADAAVRAFCKSKVANDGYILQMIGRCSDEYKQELLDIAKEYSVETSVQFIGYCSNVDNYFREASAFLMCSKFEGLGRVTVQAMANGCPVIARNSGGTTDFVINGETGYLFDTEEECSRLIQMVTSSDQSQIVQNALEMVSREFTEKAYGKKIMQIYNNLV